MAEELLFTEARSTSTGVKGRSITSARTNHWVVDLPPFHHGPGEESTPGEAFLGAVAACGALLVECFAGEEGLPLKRVQASIKGERLKSDPSWFRSIEMRFELAGVDPKQAEALVAKFQASCPLYRTVAAATKMNVVVKVV
jgi:uncharacterized OsmC-like protein